MPNQPNQPTFHAESNDGYADSPGTAPLGRYIRWQALLALLGIIALTSLLGYSAYNVSTVLVADRGGVFREGVAGNPQTINPLLCQMHEVDQDLCALLFRGLTKFNKAGEVKPDLADFWTVTPDGLTYTFHLRAEQYWHDGQPVTAADVIFTVQVMQDPDFPGVPDLAELWRAVEVEQVDDLTVRFVLAQAFAPFQNYTTIGLLPKHLWEGTPVAELGANQLNASPVGTGPMRVTEVTADHIRLEPSPFYGDSTPYISALEFHFYPDYPSLFAAYQQGEIDGISRILPTELPLAQERDDLQLFSAVEAGYVVVVFNLRNADVPFFQDKTVRQALAYGTDRARLIEVAAQGQGVLAQSPLLAESWAYNPDVKTYPYNPELASQLLDASGWIDSNGDGVRERDGRLLSFVLLTNEDDCPPSADRRDGGRLAQDRRAGRAATGQLCRSGQRLPGSPALRRRPDQLVRTGRRPGSLSPVAQFPGRRRGAKLQRLGQRAGGCHPGSGAHRGGSE